MTFAHSLVSPSFGLSPTTFFTTDTILPVIFALDIFSFGGKILFLDGWDKGTPDYAEQHLEAFKSSTDKLSDTHLILIDDTDYLTEDGGKDKLLSPYLMENNYSMLFNGRQTLFINTVI